ncbi:hypothetical protein FXO37_22179 [Capsicum annuum]|nr:hypothetical protein FXO37_22179 [Capsicum annuum]
MDMYMLDRVPRRYRYVYIGSGTTPVRISICWIGYHTGTDMYILDGIPRRHGYVYVGSGTTPVRWFSHRKISIGATHGRLGRDSLSDEQPHSSNYKADEVTEMRGHLLKYPVEIDRTEKVKLLHAYGRTVRSIAHLLEKYQDVKIYFVSPYVVKMKDDIKDYLTSMGVHWEEIDDLLEISVDVYGYLRFAYFRQAKNGLYIRMALLNLLLLGWLLISQLLKFQPFRMPRKLTVHQIIRHSGGRNRTFCLNLTIPLTVRQIFDGPPFWLSQDGQKKGLLPWLDGTIDDPPRTWRSFRSTVRPGRFRHRLVKWP